MSVITPIEFKSGPFSTSGDIFCIVPSISDYKQTQTKTKGSYLRFTISGKEINIPFRIQDIGSITSHNGVENNPTLKFLDNMVQIKIKDITIHMYHINTKHSIYDGNFIYSNDAVSNSGIIYTMRTVSANKERKQFDFLYFSVSNGELESVAYVPDSKKEDHYFLASCTIEDIKTIENVKNSASVVSAESRRGTRGKFMSLYQNEKKDVPKVNNISAFITYNNNIPIPI
jgi:hypothetical protein